MNVVWVLGAGFSKPLGGPLLADLFEARLLQEMTAIYEKVRPGFLRDLARLHEIYHGTVGNRETPIPGLPWKDPEEFLEALDFACCDAVPADKRAIPLRLIGRAAGNVAINEDAVRDYAKLARHYFVSACSSFLESAFTDTERWSPYRSWAKWLHANDTVLTFNYDEILERLSTEREPLAILTPDLVQPNGDINEMAKVDLAGRPTVVKLHGSVRWAQEPDPTGHGDRVTAHHSVNEILFGKLTPVIATPGPTKQGMAKGLLQPLWHLAAKKLRAADVVVFVGYRFPETDNQAKQVLLDAIGGRDTTRPLTVHIVLGADTAHKDVRRLDGLLRWKLAHCEIVDAREIRPHTDQSHYPPRRACIIAQPLWAQDFLAVFERRRLNAWCDYNTVMQNVAADNAPPQT